MWLAEFGIMTSGQIYLKISIAYQQYRVILPPTTKVYLCVALQVQLISPYPINK